MEKALLVVDVQPSYNRWCSSVARSVAKRINNTRKPVCIMWVGDGLTSDTEFDVREYLRENGAYRPALEQATFIEKGYGFFRQWMDNGVDHDDIIKVGQHMLKRRINSSEGVDFGELYGEDVPDFPRYGDLNLPHINSGRVLAFDHLETCGGGSQECLAEIELWLSVQGKTHNRIDHLVY